MIFYMIFAKMDIETSLGRTIIEKILFRVSSRFLF